MTAIGGSTTTVAPDPVLTGLSVELGTGGDYIADRIAPPAQVTRDDFKYSVWDRDDIKTDTRDERAPGTPANEIKFGQTFATASVTYRGLKSRIADEVRNNHPNPGSLERRRVKVLMNKIRLGIEMRIQAMVSAASNTRSAPSTKWNASSPTIRADILAAREAFRTQCGMLPNVIVLPPSVRTVVFNDSEILELLKYTSGGLLADGMIPQIENMQVISPGIIKDTANPGAAASIADLWDSDEAYYLYVDPNAGDDLDAQTALRQVRSLATTGVAFSTHRWRDPDESARADLVSVHLDQHEMVVSQAMILRQLDVLT